MLLPHQCHLSVCYQSLSNGLQGVFEVVRCGTSLRQGCVLAPFLFNIFFAAVMNVAYTRFKADRDIMDALVHLRKKRGRGAGESNRRRASPGDIAVGHAYADDVGVVSQSPEQLRNMIGLTVVACAAFGLTVPEARLRWCIYARSRCQRPPPYSA